MCKESGAPVSLIGKHDLRWARHCVVLILVQAGEFGENESFITYDLDIGTTLEQANELGIKLDLIGMWVGD